LYNKGLQVLERWVNDTDLGKVTVDVQSKMAEWERCGLSDDMLRLILWIYLRETFGLPARLCISERAGGRIADDLAAAAIHFVDPPGLAKTAKQ
jgi:hypothetical protein